MKKKNGRQKNLETHHAHATATPATAALKPSCTVPGSPTTARHLKREAQTDDASAASTKIHLKSSAHMSRPSKGRQGCDEAQLYPATSTPATPSLKPTAEMPGSLSPTVEAIRAHHRERRFAMGIQQVLDRKLESYIRINKTEWHVGDDEATRDKANKDVASKIKAARQGEGDPSIIMVVSLTDQARAPADAERARHEKEMEALARALPVAPWVETVPGLGYLGLATIIAETGDLANYANVAKVWKRLGYAPYNGKAGSTWKRPSWRNGCNALTAEEWIANPFSGKRYSLMYVISVWLKNKQWIGAAKTEDGVGQPNGPYGEKYAERRARTAETHPDWSKQHSHADGLRIMFKEVLKDLWIEWNAVERLSSIETQLFHATTETPAMAPMKPKITLPGSPIENGRQSELETPMALATATPAIVALKSDAPLPGSPNENGRPLSSETHFQLATATPAMATMKPNTELPGSPISENGRHVSDETQISFATATPANTAVKPSAGMPGSLLS